MKTIKFSKNKWYLLIFLIDYLTLYTHYFLKDTIFNRKN